MTRRVRIDDRASSSRVHQSARSPLLAGIGRCSPAAAARPARRRSRSSAWPRGEAAPVRRSAASPTAGAAGAALADGAGAPRAVGGGTAAAQDFAAAVPPASAPSSHYLLRTGDISLLVARGTLLVDRRPHQGMTTAMNGYVMSSAIGSQDGRAPSPCRWTPPSRPTAAAGSRARSRSRASTDGSNPYATLVVRVPEQFFDTAHQAVLQARRGPERRRPRARTSPPSSSTCRPACATTAPSSGASSASSRRPTP